MSQAELGSVAKISTVGVQHAEHGVMPSLPYKIYTALYNAERGDQPSYHEVNFRIEAWKTDTRRKNRRHIDYLIENPETWFSWMDFRTAISSSKSGFCKLYCIHPHVLDHFEAPDKVEKRNRLADKIRKAFYDAGISERDIGLIESKLAWHTSGY